MHFLTIVLLIVPTLPIVLPIEQTYIPTPNAQLNAIKDVEARQRRLVELNVQEQCLNVFKTGVVQRKRKQTHDEIVNSQSMVCSRGYNFTWPRIHALVYDPAVGILNKLPINLKEIKQEMQDIYTIY